MNAPILVTCAHGVAGSAAVQRLAAAGLRVRAGVRAGARPGARHPLVQEVPCELSQRASVQRALAGVEAVFLITPVAPESADHAAQLIDEARQAGMRHVVRLSGLVAAAPRETLLGRWHASTEQHLACSGLRHAILRPTLFMQNFATYYRPDALGYFYAACGTARANHVDVRDVAEVAVRLIERRAMSSAPMTLTGPAALRSTEVADTLSAATGRAIVAARITPRQAALAMRLMGMPRWAATAFRQIHELMCDGFYDCVSPAVPRQTGQAARSFARFASDHASHLAGRGAGWAASVAAQMLVRVAPK